MFRAVLEVDQDMSAQPVALRHEQRRQTTRHLQGDSVGHVTEALRGHGSTKA